MILELRGVSVHLAGEVVLKDINLSVGAGEVIVVRGRSGVGKTTLARVAALLIRPEKGNVIILGRDVGNASDSVRSSIRLLLIGYVDQSYTLIPSLTLLENVALPLRLSGTRGEEARRRAMKVMEALGIGHLARRYPREVSGGQRQRAAIARALVKRPKLLIADEPLSNLDDETATEVMRVITTYVTKENAGALITTTDLLTEYAGVSREFILKRGFLVPRGTHKFAFLE